MNELIYQDTNKVSAIVHSARSEFCGELAKKKMYVTIALAGNCRITIDSKMPALAAVSIETGKQPTMYLHPLMADLYLSSKKSFFTIMLHELRHLIQAASFSKSLEYVDMSPLLKIYSDLSARATDPKAKAVWDHKISGIENNKPYWQNIRARIANVTMDSALHEDVLPIFSEAKTEKGYHDTEYEISQFLKRDDVIEALTKQKPEPADPNHPEKDIVICTVPGLMETLENPNLKRNGEWVFYADEYIKFLAKKMEEKDQDPNMSGMFSQQPPPPPGGGGGEGDGNPKQGNQGEDPGQEKESDEEQEPKSGLDDLVEKLLGAGSLLDDHSELENEEAQEALKEILKRAEEDGKLLAHRAGSQPADSVLGATPDPLWESTKRAIQQLKVMFKRIWQEDGRTTYSYFKVNKKLPDSGLPGKTPIVSPKKAVVLLLDTSGSMFDSKMFNQYAAVIKTLHNKKMLSKVFAHDCGDPVEVNVSNLHNLQFQGGGGTSVSKENIDFILKSIGLTKGVDIVYLTDEYVDLRHAYDDKRIKFHVFNIEKFSKQG